MRQVFIILICVAFLLGVLCMFAGYYEKWIEGRNPPARYFPDNQPGKRFLPRLNQPH